MQTNPHSSRSAKGAQTARNKGITAAKAGRPVTDCPYKESPGSSQHINFGRRWRQNWLDGYRSVKKKQEPMPP